MRTSSRAKTQSRRPARKPGRRQRRQSTPAHSATPLSAEESVRQAADAIVNALPSMVEAVIAQACEGSHVHARFLCEFAGLSAAAMPAAGEAAEPSLAQLLLERLDLQEPTPAPVAADTVG
ncbi:MAG: hypothetical protein ACRD2R_07205 [Terriglobales bacterium]